MFPTKISIRVYAYPTPDQVDPEIGTRLLNLVLPIPGHLLVATLEPHQPGDELHYLVQNDDLYAVLVNRYPDEAEMLRQIIPLGQVTKVPINCCEVYQPKELT